MRNTLKRENQKEKLKTQWMNEWITQWVNRKPKIGSFQCEKWEQINEKHKRTLTLQQQKVTTKC